MSLEKRVVFCGVPSHFKGLIYRYSSTVVFVRHICFIWETFIIRNTNLNIANPLFVSNTFAPRLLSGLSVLIGLCIYVVEDGTATVWVLIPHMVDTLSNTVPQQNSRRRVRVDMCAKLNGWNLRMMVQKRIFFSSG